MRVVCPFKTKFSKEFLKKVFNIDFVLLVLFDLLPEETGRDLPKIWQNMREQ